MSKKLYSLVSLCFFTLANPLFASDADKQELKLKLASLKTFSAEFHQIVKDEQGVTVAEGKGNLLLESPLKMRWAQQQPDQTLFVSDGSKGFYYDSFAEQVTVMDSKRLIEQTPFVLLTSDDDKSWSNYSVEKEQISYVIKPIEVNGQQVEKLRVQFDEQGTFAVVALTDVSGQTSSYTFSNTQTNTPIEQTQFEFVIPEGVFVDDQSKGE
jgi:outer membrane lipoprotein carrier protein